MSKDFNRYQQSKALNKARKIVKRWYRFSKPDEEAVEKHARRIRDNRQVCSCHMCGNPRTSVYAKGKGKLTIQEIKQHERDRTEDCE